MVTCLITAIGDRFFMESNGIRGLIKKLPGRQWQDGWIRFQNWVLPIQQSWRLPGSELRLHDGISWLPHLNLLCVFGAWESGKGLMSGISLHNVVEWFDVIIVVFAWVSKTQHFTSPRLQFFALHFHPKDIIYWCQCSDVLWMFTVSSDVFQIVDVLSVM